MAERKWFFNGKSYTRAQLEQFVAPGDTVDDLINFIDSGQQAYEMPRDPNTGLTIPFEGTGQAPDPVPIPMSELRGGSGADSMIGGGGRDTLGARSTIQTPNGVTLRVSAKTGLNGLSERTRAIIAGMAQAAPAAGISVIDITAGKEGGHLSHAGGTEVDLKAYSADGSLWTPEQRVALAAGAQAGGADRVGLYSFGKGKLGSGTLHVGYSGPGRPAAVWGADSKVRGPASRRFSNPAERAFLASYQAGRPFDAASLGLTPLGAVQPQTAQSAISDLVNPAGGTQVPDAPTAAMGYAPTIPDAGFGAPPAPPSVALPMPQPPPQWAQATGFPDVGGAGQDAMLGGPTPPMPRLRDQSVLEQQRADQLDEALFGAGPHRGDFARGRPEGRWMEGAGGAPDATTVPMPGISPMRPAVGGPNDRRPQPPTPQTRPDNFVWHGGGAPDNPPNPPSNPRRDPFGFPIDVNRPRINNPDGSFSTEQTITFNASEVGLPDEIVTIPTIINGQKVSDQTAMFAFARGLNPAVQRGFDSYEEAERGAVARTNSIAAARATNGMREGMFPTVFGEQPPPAMDGMSSAMGGPPAPPRPPAISAVTGSEQFGPGTKSGLAQYQMYMPPEQYGPGDATGRIRYDNYLVGQDMQRRNEEFGAALDSRFLAGDLGFRRAQMERYMPDYRAPPTATMGERFDAASPYPNADQMFGLAPLNGASFPAPPPVVGTAEAGSTTGEFFTPAPPMPQPPPDPMAGRFEDAFSPGGPGMIADLQGAYDARQGSPQPGMTAQDGINQIFGAPPAPAAVPNLAIPFAEVPGIGPSPAEAATVASPLPQPMTQGDFSARFGGPPMPSAAPQPISQQQFDERFAGGTVTPSPPKPGQPGVVAGEMPTPAGAMDIRPPAQGGPGLPPAPANPGALPGSAPAMPSPSPSSPPRQPNPGAERQRKGIIGRVLGGLLGGPVGALGGGLLGGGFGGAQTFTPYGNPIMNTGMGSFRTSGTSPYGTNGTTNWKSGQSNALGGSNALQWTGSKGQTITAVTDPWTGQTYTSYGP